MNIAMLGPSGAGKGTVAGAICQRFALRHIVTGDLLRGNIEKHSAIGLLIRGHLARQEMAPDDLVEALIEEYLEGLFPNQGILLDGFPRTDDQARFLDELFARTERQLDAVVYFDVPESVVLQRLSGRRLCARCHAPYHLRTHPPTTPNICDHCGGALYSRADDEIELARRRLRSFLRHAASVLKHYQATGRVFIIDATKSARTVEQELIALLARIRVGEASGVGETELQKLLVRIVPAPIAPSIPERNAANLALLGAPGSGKGTQAEALTRDFSLRHIASGDLFRQHLKNETELGQLARSYMSRGELVPDEITEAMIEERLSHEDAAEGFLLDGFPRTLPQAKALGELTHRLGRPLSGVLYLEVPDSALVDRLAGRWICRQCQAPYHITQKPPAKQGICDQCGGPLCQREDDKPETVRIRLKTFHRMTEPLIEYYQNAGLLARFDGQGDVRTVQGRAHAAVEEVLSRSGQRRLAEPPRINHTTSQPLQNRRIYV